MEIKRPDMGPHDLHVVVADYETRHVGSAQCFNASGVRLWQIPAIGKGVNGPSTKVRGGDTPPGLYLAGKITESQPGEPRHLWNQYGRWFIDMIERQEQERSIGRSEIGWHGGGTGLPDPLAPRQRLIATLGCVRSHNEDMHKVVIPALHRCRAEGGQMWITVHQF